MYWDIVTVTSEPDLTLAVCFSDGLCGKVRFLPSHLTGVFTPLNDSAFFDQVYLHDGVVTWPGEIDLAPDAMHEAIKQHGIWLLS